MMNSNDIPKSMLIDIVKVFLMGTNIYYIDTQTGQKFCYVRHLDVDYAANWDDIIGIREQILYHLKQSKDERLIRLAKAMEDVYSDSLKT